MAARLLVDGASVSEDVCFPAGMRLPMQDGSGVRARLAARDDGTRELRLASDVFLQAVAIGCGGAIPDDNGFHLLPGDEKVVVLKGDGGAVHIGALNLAGAIEATP